jgi:hypothetical protein
MFSADGTEPLSDDELLYRRIPASQGWYTEGVLSPEVYGPHRERDVDGISFWRAKYRCLEEVARGRPGKDYYVAVIRVGELRMRGIEVMPTPCAGGVGHVSLPALNAENRRTPEAHAMKALLCKLTHKVEGPFHTLRADETKQH